MKKKSFALALSAMLFALCASAHAQQPKKVPRVGYISGTGSPANRGPYFEVLRQGLQSLGYVEGKNIAFEFRGAGGKTAPLKQLVNELVDLNVDVMVIPMGGALYYAKQATQTIPIVMMTQIDPVDGGIVDSLAHPGGNITGLSSLQRNLSGKRMELLKEIIPALSRVGILHDTDPQSETAVQGLKGYVAAAQVFKITALSLGIKDPNLEFEGAFRDAMKERVGALVTITNNTTFPYAKRITGLAIKHHLPSMFEGTTWVDNGGLMSYSAQELELFRRAAVYVDKILKGAKPANLPVEQPTKFEFVFNLNTAKQIGLKVPPNVLARADRVIR